MSSVSISCLPPEATTDARGEGADLLARQIVEIGERVPDQERDLRRGAHGEAACRSSSQPIAPCVSSAACCNPLRLEGFLVNHIRFGISRLDVADPRRAPRRRCCGLHRRSGSTPAYRRERGGRRASEPLRDRAPPQNFVIDADGVASGLGGRLRLGDDRGDPLSGEAG